MRDCEEQALLTEWIVALPKLVDSIPDVQEIHVLQMGAGENQLASFLAQQATLFDTLRQFLQHGTGKITQPMSRNEQPSSGLSSGGNPHCTNPHLCYIDSQPGI